MSTDPKVPEEMIEPSQRIFKFSCTYFFLFLSIFVIYFIVTLPILQAGYYSDDIRDSLVRGVIELNHTSLWQVINNYMYDWLANGRFFPLNVVSTTLVFYFSHNLLSYQFIRLSFILLSLLAFAWLVKLITRNNKASLLFLIIVPLTWSIKTVWDPFTTFAIFIPLLALLMALSLGAFIRFIENKNQHWLDLSFFCFLCSLLTYELGIILIVFLSILAIFSKNRSELLKKLTPFFLLTFFYLLLNLKLHLSAAHVYPGVSLGSLKYFFATFWAQLVSSFPLSYYFFQDKSIHLFQTSHFILLIFLCINFTVIFTYLSSTVKINRRSSLLLLIVGVLLMILPAALVALSENYQRSVTAGAGYLPVYMQNIGCAFLFIYLLNFISRRFVQVIVGVGAGVLLMMVVAVNFQSVSEANQLLEKDKRLLLENALQHHLFNQSEINTLVLNDTFMIGKLPEFFLTYGGVRIKYISENAIKNAYQMSFYQLPHSNEGYVLLKKENYFRLFMYAKNQDRYNQIKKIFIEREVK